LERSLEDPTRKYLHRDYLDEHLFNDTFLVMRDEPEWFTDEDAEWLEKFLNFCRRGEFRIELKVYGRD
jgi:hypothetical protein